MSKRKSATTTKHARNPKRAAQRAKQTIVRSRKDSGLLSGAAGSTELPSERHNVLKREAPLDDPAKAVVGNPATVAQEHYKQMMRDVDLKQASSFSSTTANVRTYQAKLLELTQANMQFALEFAAKLAAIRSPIDIFGLIVEFSKPADGHVSEDFDRDGRIGYQEMSNCKHDQ